MDGPTSRDHAARSRLRCRKSVRLVRRVASSNAILRPIASCER